MVREECGIEIGDPYARPGNKNAAKPKFDPETGEIIEENASSDTTRVSEDIGRGADYYLARLRRDAEVHPDPGLRAKAGDLLELHRDGKVRTLPACPVNALVLVGGNFPPTAQNCAVYVFSTSGNPL